MENTKEIDKFIDSYKQPMLNNKDRNLNRPKINKEFETVIKGPPTKKDQTHMDSLQNSNRLSMKTYNQNFSNYSANRKKRDIVKLFLWSKHYSNNKSRGNF